jgi:hypothetical protein
MMRLEQGVAELPLGRAKFGRAKLGAGDDESVRVDAAVLLVQKKQLASVCMKL